MVSPLAVDDVLTPIIVHDSLPDVTKHTNQTLNNIVPNSNKRKLPDAQYVINQHVRSLGNLPTDLTKLFLPLYCELCGIHSNSPISARAHYNSVGHDKKINAWLLKREQEMGEPNTKKTKVQKFDSKIVKLANNLRCLFI